MKKILFSVAILAVAASCSKNEVVETTKTSEISFSTLNDRVLTKSANDSNSDYVVYASLVAEPTAWFIGGAVVTEAEDSSATTDPTTGTTGTYYWDGNDYSFFAYAPEGSELATVTATDYTKLSIDYSITSASTEDFTTASIDSQDEGNVALEFTHALAKVTVVYELSEGLEASGYEMVGTANLGVLCNAATYTIDASVTNVAATGGAATYTGEEDALTGEFNIIPTSSAANYTVQLTNVTISKEGSSNILTDGDLYPYTILGLEDNLTTGFAAGSHYVLTVTVTDAAIDDDGGDVFGTAITFSASYTDWSTQIDVAVDSPEEEFNIENVG